MDVGGRRTPRARTGLFAAGATVAAAGALVLLGCGSDATEPESAPAAAAPAADAPAASGSDASGAAAPVAAQPEPETSSVAGADGEPVETEAAVVEAAVVETAADMAPDEVLEVLEPAEFAAADEPVAGTRQDEPAVPAVSEGFSDNSTLAGRPARLGDAYQWEDGDRSLEARLMLDLTVVADGALSDAAVVADTGAGQIVAQADVARGAPEVPGDLGTVDSAVTAGQPVFLSDSGQLMTLPGGVIVVLDESWSSDDTDGFFARNGIAPRLVQELDYLVNGFIVETGPGFASLDLANALASQPGVYMSSPNWWTEQVPR